MDAKSDVDMLQVQIGSEPGPFIGGQGKVAVLYEPGLDQVVAQGMKVVLGFPKAYGPYAFSSITARKGVDPKAAQRSEEHTSELQSLMRNSYAVFCLKKKNKHKNKQDIKGQQKITAKHWRD